MVVVRYWLWWLWCRQLRTRRVFPRSSLRAMNSNETTPADEVATLPLSPITTNFKLGASADSIMRHATLDRNRNTVSSHTSEITTRATNEVKRTEQPAARETRQEPPTSETEPRNQNGCGGGWWLVVGGWWLWVVVVDGRWVVSCHVVLIRVFKNTSRYVVVVFRHHVFFGVLSSSY